MKKFLAVLTSVLLLFSAFMPIAAVAESTPTASIYLSAPVLENIDGTDYLKIDVNIADNSSALYVVSYQILNSDGLSPINFKNGTFSDTATDTSLDLTYTLNPRVILNKGYTGIQVLQDSNGGYNGISTQSGVLGTAYFLLPTEVGVYTFSLVNLGADNIYTNEQGEADTLLYTVTVGEDVTYEVVPYVCPHTETTETVIEPTCTEKGSKTVTCKECGEVVSTEEIDALGHKEGKPVWVAPTETQQGSNTVSCTVCGEILSQEIFEAYGPFDPASPTITLYMGEPTVTEVNGKKYIVVSANVSDNTSDLYVIKYYVMSKEGLTPVNFDNGTFEDVYYDFLNRPQYIALGATTTINSAEITNKGYTGIQIVQDSTGGTDGISTESGCIGYVWFELPDLVGEYTFIIEADGCNNVYTNESGSKVYGEYRVTVPGTVSFTVSDECKHTQTQETVVNATCTEKGSKTVTCEVCGETISAEEISALGHSEGEAVRVEPSCYKDGSVTVSCTVCGEQLSKETIAATGEHVFKSNENASDLLCHCATDGCPATKLSGDVNLDGKVDTTDLAQVKVMIAEQKIGYILEGDINNDGEFSTTDLALLKLWIAQN